MHLRRGFFASTVASACLLDLASAYLQFEWNTEKYFGPDGPWQGITLGVQPLKNSNQQQITLLPAIQNPNTIAYFPTASACAAFPNTNCGAGGMIPLPANWSYVYWYSSTDVQDNWHYNYTGPSDTIDTLYLPGGITQTSTIASACTSMNTTYPNGKVLAAEIGLYSLGGATSPNTISTPGSLFTSSSHITQSNSFGLHYGAAGLGYKGSLIFGGYDPARAIGPVINFNITDSNSVNLLDIVIGVETGGSPFSFDSIDNLLVVDASSKFAQSSPAQVYANTPYIYLPQAALDKIASLLPVKLDKSGYYLWDTKDESYQKIVSSPAYLGFKFQTTPNGVGDTVIKIPFALLNMTLSSLITGYDTDVPYLPLVVVNDSSDVQPSVWLGRTFLQGAYFAVNWGTNTSWLAQAPGPGDGNGLGLNPLNLNNKQVQLEIQTDSTLFSKSWENHWTALPSKAHQHANNTHSPTPTPSPKPSGGLSGGAIAGIVVGVVVGIALVIALLFVRRRRQRQSERERNAGTTTDQTQSEKTGDAPAGTHDATASVLPETVGPHPKAVHESQQYYATSPAPHYGDYHQTYTHPPYYMPNELHGESQMPNELPDNSREPPELPAGDYSR